MFVVILTISKDKNRMMRKAMEGTAAMLKIVCGRIGDHPALTQQGRGMTVINNDDAVTEVLDITCFMNILNIEKERRMEK